MRIGILFVHKMDVVRCYNLYVMLLCQFQKNLVYLYLMRINILLCILVIGGLTSPLLRLFYPADATFSFAEYAPLGRRLIIIFLVWSVFDTLSVVLGGALKGAGDTTFVVCWVGGVALFFWMPTLFLLYRHGASIEVLWLSLLTNVIITGLGTLVRFLLGRWKRIRLIHDA